LSEPSADEIDPHRSLTEIVVDVNTQTMQVAGHSTGSFRADLVEPGGATPSLKLVCR
jgi:hypothetical protein